MPIGIESDGTDPNTKIGVGGGEGGGGDEPPPSGEGDGTIEVPPTP